MSSPDPSSKLTPATGVRFRVLGLLCLLAMITYMDRAANGSAKTAIMADLNKGQPPERQYQTEDFFIVLMAFQLAYALFEIPSGWLGDTRGPRATLLRVVLWWTAFVGLTGLTGLTLPGGLYVGFGALVVIQFLFGVGEAGAFPNISKALYNWFPAGDRGFAKSAVWSCARLMGGLTPLVWLLVTGPRFLGLSWREAMWLFASVAGVWCVVFYAVFRNKPAEHPGVSPAELASINAGRVEQKGRVVVPWAKLIRSRNLWCICLMYVVTNFCWYFLMYNLPGALRKQFAGWATTPFGEVQLALLAGSPLLVGMLGCLLGGTLSDRHIKRTGDRKWGRRLPGMIGYGLAGLCYFAAAGARWAAPDNLYLFAGLLILMGFCNDLIMAPAWAVCQDVGRDYAATVSGAMNMFGNLVGAVSGILFTGLIDKRYGIDQGTHGILICFTTYGLVYFVGVGLWLLIDASKPIVSDQAAAIASG